MREERVPDTARNGVWLGWGVTSDSNEITRAEQVDRCLREERRLGSSDLGFEILFETLSMDALHSTRSVAGVARGSGRAGAHVRVDDLDPAAGSTRFGFAGDQAADSSQFRFAGFTEAPLNRLRALGVDREQ